MEPPGGRHGARFRGGRPDPVKPVIRLKKVTKTYRMGSRTIYALDEVNLRVNPADYLAVIGASGSGKSTLMNIIGCLDRPDSGRYRLAGEDVSRLNDDQLALIRNRKIGFIFQTFNLLPRMSALENVKLPLLYRAERNAGKIAVQTLEEVGLGERINHRPNELSGGQRQRVAIARALVTDPEVLLADEPTGNLDTTTGQEILSLFDSLNEAGRTIIMVTHEPEIAKRCSRRITLRDGKIVRREETTDATLEHT